MLLFFNRFLKEKHKYLFFACMLLLLLPAGLVAEEITSVFHNDLQAAKQFMAEGEQEKARKILLFLLESKSENAEIHLQLGMLEMKEKKFNKAEEQFQFAVDLGLLDAGYQLADLFRKQRRFNDVLKVYDNLIEKDERNLKARLGVLGVYKEIGKIQLMEELLLTLDKEFPNNVKVLRELGLLHWNKQNTKVAIEYMERTVALDESYFEAALSLATFYQAVNMMPKAVALYVKIVKNSTDLEQQKLSNMWMDYLGHSEQEVVYIKKQLIVVNSLLREKKLPEAVNIMQKLIVLVPSEYNIKFKLALTYLNMQKIDKAIELLLDVIRLKPGFLNAYAFLGNVYEMKGDSDNAEDAYEDYLTQSSVRMDSLKLELVLVFLEMNKHKEAVVILRDLLERKPRLIEAHEYLIRAYEEMGKKTKAKKAGEKLKALKVPKNRKPKKDDVTEIEKRLFSIQEKLILKNFFKTAEKHIKDGKPLEAIKVLEGAAQIYGESAEIFFKLALWQASIGNLAKGLEEIAKASVLDKKNILVEFSQATLLQGRGQFKGALKGYLRVIALDPKMKTQYGRDSLEYMKKLPELEAEAAKKAKDNYDIAMELVRSDPDAALSAMRKAFTDYPSGYAINVGMGDIMEMQSELDTAILFYENGRKLDTSRSEANLKLGRLYIKKKYYRLAQKRFTSALVSSDLNVKLKAELKIKVSLISERVEQNRKKVDKLLVSVKQKSKKGKFDSALIQLEKAEKLDKDNPNLYFNKGIIYSLKGETQLAKSAFLRASKLDPTRYQDRLRLAMIYEKELNLHLARNQYLLVIDLGSQNMRIADVKKAKERLVSMQNLERVRRMSNWHFTRGGRFLAKGQNKKALAQFLKAVKLGRKDEGYFFKIGFALELLGENLSAIVAQKIALAINPDFMDAHFRLATVFDKSMRYREAVKEYRKTLALAGDMIFPERTRLEARYNALAKRLFGSLNYSITINDNASQLAEGSELELVTNLMANVTYFILKGDKLRIYTSLAPSLVRYAKFQILFNSNSLNLTTLYAFSNNITASNTVGVRGLLQKGGILYADKTMSLNVAKTGGVFPAAWSVGYSYTNHHLRDKKNIGFVVNSQSIEVSENNKNKNDFDRVSSSFSLSASHNIRQLFLTVGGSFVNNNVVDPDEDSLSYNASLSGSMPLYFNNLSGNFRLSRGFTSFLNVDSSFQQKRENQSISFSSGVSYRVDSNFSLSGSYSLSKSRSTALSLNKSVEQVATESATQVGGFESQSISISADVNF